MTNNWFKPKNTLVDYTGEITPDEAESFLKSLVNLYDSLSNKE